MAQSDRVIAEQAQGPEFKPQYHQKKNKICWSMAQVVECLPKKCKALRVQNHKTEKKKKKSLVIMIKQSNC
jgi:hypothetical protein